jgi:hypothetical protein
MKKVFLILLSVISLQTFGQKTVVDPNAKIRSISSDFTAVSVATGIELMLTQADNVSLAVSANDAKYEQYIKTEVDNGVLHIYYDNKDKNNNNWDRGRKIKAYLSVKTINKLTGSSGANIELVNALNVPKLDLRMSSGSQFNGEVKATDLEVDQSSGSEIKISGTASNLEVDASSGAAFKGYDLTTDNCTAKASSGADIKITTNKELNASASSGGNIVYKGNATTKDVSKSSGGSVRKG